LSALARELEAGIEGMSAPQLHDCVGTLCEAFEQTAEFARASLLQPAY